MKSIEEIVASGDLTDLTPEQRIQHCQQVCESLGLDHRTRPLAYMKVKNFNGGETTVLYVLRNGTDQLRKVHGINVKIVSKEIVDDICIYTASATDKHGRVDESVGAVSLRNLIGRDRANQIMAAETKAKRRVTLSIAGAGLLDETEVADMHTSATTVATPGIGVSAPPPQVSTPAVNNIAAVEVHPPLFLPQLFTASTPLQAGDKVERNGKIETVLSIPVPVGKDPRIDMYGKEVLSAGRMQSKPGQTIGAKWAKFVFMLAGVKTRAEMTPALWVPILTKLDQVRDESGDTGVVKFIEDTIAMEQS